MRPEPQAPDPEAWTDLWSFAVEENRVERIDDHGFHVYDDWMTCGGTVAGVRAD